MNHEEATGLADLLRRVERGVAGALPGSYWVRGEISELKRHVSGHCYLTLVEKEPGGNFLAAKANAVVWASTWNVLAPFFESQAGTRLAEGMQVLVQARVQFTPLYSLSLIIENIDPSYTVGEAEMARRRTIALLQEQGMMELNRSLSLPPLPRRLAIVSSSTAAGYRDFIRHLEGNGYGFTFSTTLFPALMQGEGAPASIISALDEVAARGSEFDAVLLMRGGGAAMDMVCFDDYELALNIAQFPLPVLTGIGHDHDVHVADLVAHTSVKTPTALADMLIDVFAAADYELSTLERRLQGALRAYVSAQEARFDQLGLRLSHAVKMRLGAHLQRLELLQGRVSALDPSLVLERGYAWVLRGGRRLESLSQIRAGERLTLVMRDGKMDVLTLPGYSGAEPSFSDAAGGAAMEGDTASECKSGKKTMKRRTGGKKQ